MSSATGVFATYRQRFEADLERYGLTTQADGRWRGAIEVTWHTDDGTRVTGDEEIAIDLPTGFPFAKPRVTPLSADPAVTDSLHREESGPVCLWRDDSSGWHPGMSVGEVLERTREWFIRCREGTWRDDEKPADLYLYYPKAALQTVVVVTEDWVLPATDTMGRFGVWQAKENELVAFAGDPQTRHAFPSRPIGNRVLEQLSLPNDQSSQVGIWFRIDREPPRVRNAAALFAFLDSAASATSGTSLQHAINAVGAKVHGTDWLYVAIEYPGPTSERHLLFLKCDLRKRQGKKWTPPLTLREIHVTACIVAPADKESLMRRVGPVAERVGDKRVVIFGVGAIGSEIAVLLAKSGLRHLVLVDSDRLMPANAVRHVAGLRYSGTPKPFAVESRIRDHVPSCMVEVHDATWDPDALRKIASNANLIVDATAQPAFSFLINELAIAAVQTVIYVSAHRRAGVGRIRVVRPHKDACLTCYEGSTGHVSKPGYPVIPELEGTTFVEEGCGTPTAEGAAIDLQLTANTAARQALDEIVGDSRSESQVLVVVTPVPDGCAPLDARGIHGAIWLPIAGCESCGQ